MWTTSGIKAQGKAAFKLNYWKSVLVSFLLGLLTAGTVTFSYRQNSGDTQQTEQAIEQIQGMFNSLTPGQRIGVIAGLSGAATIVIAFSVVLKIFVFNPLKVGCYTFFKDNVQDPPAGFDSIGLGFRNYGHTFVTLFLTDLFIALWTLLLIIPGIVKSYSYRMVPYILAEHPELSATETIARSKEMMNGHKWHAFCYDLSFIGWYILEILTLGILGLFWVDPYKYNSDAVLYLAVRDF